MRKVTVFYAWQSDTPQRFNRYLIRTALEVAARRISDDAASGVELRVDADTEGVPGQPPITETILRKIADCDIFAPDFTFVARSDDGKFIPNPNVMVEYGYALRAKTHAAMMPVMNTAFGPPENLPFDMRHLRYPIQYHVSPTARNAERRAGRKLLCGKLEEALRLTIATPADGRIGQDDFLTAAREFSASRTGLVQAGGFLPTVLVRGPRMIIHLMPVSAFQPGATIDHTAMAALRSLFKPAHFLDCEGRTNAGGWLLWGPPQELPPPFQPVSWWCSRVTNEGITEIVETLIAVGQDDPPPVIEGYPLEDRIVNTLDRVADGYAGLGIASPALLQITLLDVMGVRLTRPRSESAYGFDWPSVTLPELYLDRITKPMGNRLRPLFDSLWRAAGWSDGSQSFQHGDWAGYGDGRIQ